MPPTQEIARRAASLLACGSAVAVLVSIAVSHTLLALALAALLVSGEKLRLPPIKLPLALFVVGTLAAVALSADPAAGRPQIRKFFVFLALPVMFSLVRRLEEAARLVLVWAGVAMVSAAKSLFQFYTKWEDARVMGFDFYRSYIADRTTGFMSHWMTFGGQMMIVLALLAAFLFFSPARRRALWFWLLCAAVIGLAVFLNFTRGIWLATAASGLYLLWFWRKPFVLIAPAVLALAVWLGPSSVRERFESFLRPRGELDSNLHRVVTWRTGLRMIRAHPWFGLGPELVNLRFKEYLPPDAPNPLPAGWYGHLHNIYLQYAAERGLPTLAVLLWLVGKILWDFLAALRRLPAGLDQRKFLLHGAVAVVIGVMITGLFEYNLGDSEVLLLFLVTVSLGYTAREAGAGEPACPAPVTSG
jgi:O-antigen ligase